jgi:hypothetical protein
MVVGSVDETNVSTFPAGWLGGDVLGSQALVIPPISRIAAIAELQIIVFLAGCFEVGNGVSVPEWTDSTADRPDA